MRALWTHYEKILVGLCIAGFIAMAAMSTTRFQEIDEQAVRNPAEGIPIAPYEAEIASMPAISTALWPEAEAQSRGDDWVYDVFTPPVIYYNRESGEFTVTPPSYGVPVADAADTTFEVSLVEVRQEPYRVQLRGYIGDDDAYIATFELMETGETVIGREGKVFDRGQFTLNSFEVRQTTTSLRDSMPVVETIAVAVITDDRTGREETLTNREMKMLPRLQAILDVGSAAVERRMVREGGSIEVNGYTYMVVQLSLNPPQAVVSRRSPESLGASDTRMLTPAGAAGADAFSGGAAPGSRSIFSTPSRR